MAKADFEDQLKELEQIVEWFASEDVDIDQAVIKYENGMKIANRLQSRLKDAEFKINEIKNLYPVDKDQDND